MNKNNFFLKLKSGRLKCDFLGGLVVHTKLVMYGDVCSSLFLFSGFLFFSLHSCDASD